MTFSASLAGRVRDVLRGQPRIAEKKMFGGVAFLLNGNMVVAVWKDLLIVRLGPEVSDEALQEPYVREFDVTGRPMKGWVMVEPDGVESEGLLKKWIERAMTFVETLPAK